MDKSFINELLKEFKTPLTNPVLVFSLILFIILLSPIILKKLNIPGIIGLIISGVIIGPHGLNLLAKNSAVDLFSTIGLLYIMFIAGLELDLKEFQRHKNKSLVFGLLTFALPLMIGFPVCYYLLKYNVNSSFLTASMFATHTLVAYPIVTRFGISKNHAVAITVGGTILTDTAVLIILAIVMGSARGTLDQAFWIRLGTSLIFFSIIMFLIIPRIAKWFFEHLESEKTSHYIFVLSVVFFAAFLAQAAGVEPIIGAFVAGLALNKLIPHSSALMNRIEFIGNALFIPFFLISVGMLVNIKVIFHGPMALIVAFTLTISAICGKWLASFFIQKIYSYKASERQLIFGLSSAHAAATLAIILVGYQEGILDENILNGTIILILVTCLVASFVTENAAKKIVLETENDYPQANEANNPNEHILLPIQNFSKMESLLEVAVLIKDKKSTNPITVLSVVPNNMEAERNIVIARKNLEKMINMASATETNINVMASIDHNFTSGVIRTSKEIMANIILMELPEKQGFIDKVFGEKIESILTGKIMLFYQSKKILVSHKRLLIFCPPLMEMESGFSDLIVLLLRLTKELSINIVCYANPKSMLYINTLSENKKIGNIQFKQFSDWDDFLVLSKDIENDDILVPVLSRKGSVSYQSMLDTIPLKFEKHFINNTKILVFLQRNDSQNLADDYEEVNIEPIVKGIESLQKLGKGIGNIFKK